MHHRATPHRRSVCALRAIKNPSLKNARLSGGVATEWKGEEGTEDFFSVRSDIHHWWVWWDRLRYETIHFLFVSFTNPLKIQIKFAIKMIVEKCDSPEDLCSLWTRARTLNNITKQFSRLSRRRNIHTKNQHFRYYISETQHWPLARFALALCVCGKWWWETAIISAVMLLLLLLEHFFYEVECCPTGAMQLKRNCVRFPP